MAIYVLEDNLLQGQAIIKIIKGICDLKKFPETEIICCAKPQTLLQSMVSNCETHMFFLDINIKKNRLCGLETAQKIRENDRNSVIAFITSHSDFALQSYKYYSKAIAFIEKTQNIEKMIDEISKVLEIFFNEMQFNEQQDTFCYSTKTSTFKFLFREIFFFESIFDHRIRCHTLNQTIDFYGSLGQISKMDERLFRSHQSYLVNLSNIKLINKSSRMIVMSDNTEIPISRNYYKSLMEVLLTK